MVHAILKKVTTFLLPVNGGESLSLIIAFLFGLTGVERLDEDPKLRVKIRLADADVGAALGLFDQAEGLEMDHRLADGVAGDTETFRQLAFGG